MTVLWVQIKKRFEKENKVIDMDEQVEKSFHH